MKIKLLVVTVLLFYSWDEATAEEVCYSLRERRIDLCLSKVDGSKADIYQVYDLKLKVRDTGLILFHTESLVKLSDEPSSTKNKLTLGALMPNFLEVRVLMAVEKFIGYKMSPVQFDGSIDFDRHMEEGSVVIGEEHFTYYRIIPEFRKKIELTLGKL